MSVILVTFQTPNVFQHNNFQFPFLNELSRQIFVTYIKNSFYLHSTII
jgi:hypothetical protein